MEWVETTAKTLDAAKELALDRLGVAADEAEFEVLEEPRPGLFGRLRGEARVRARVMPTAVRPKQERRRGRQRDGKGTPKRGGASAERRSETASEPADAPASSPAAAEPSPEPRARPARARRAKQDKEQQVSTEQTDDQQVSPAEVGAAAEEFMAGLVSAFGASASTSVEIDRSDIDVRVTGSDLGLLVGHGGRTLLAVQDLARVASQRRLGDHDTRLRIDVAGYREKRNAALARFAVAVANQVIESGAPKALEPMQSADRKIVHDALAGIDGVTSRSEGDDPMRRVVISPA